MDKKRLSPVVAVAVAAVAVAAAAVASRRPVKPPDHHGAWKPHTK